MAVLEEEGGREICGVWCGRHDRGSGCCACRGRADELERTEQQSNQPDEHEDAGGVGFGEPVELWSVPLVLTYHTQSYIVLDGRRLQHGGLVCVGG